jgi:hypothetical protein
MIDHVKQNHERLDRLAPGALAAIQKAIFDRGPLLPPIS